MNTKLLNNIKLYIGPMSKNIVDSVIDYSNEKNTMLGLIPSRRQIEYDGGYVNNWTTEAWATYVREKSKLIILERDHGGPNQGEKEDSGLRSFYTDVHLLDILHVDIWKVYRDIHSALYNTIDYINLCYKLNPNVLFEVGTEEAIQRIELNEFEKFLFGLKNNLAPEMFDRIAYVVVQSGTKIQQNKNIGKFSQERLVGMNNLIKMLGLKSKEHNGDHLTADEIKMRYALGLDAINIAPEFGMMESNIILSLIKDYEFEQFFLECFKSNRWKKWVDSSFNPFENKKELIQICGHYLLSNEKIIHITSRYPQIPEMVKQAVFQRIDSILID
jgi:hypothetical protein